MCTSIVGLLENRAKQKALVTGLDVDVDDLLSVTKELGALILEELVMLDGILTTGLEHPKREIDVDALLHSLMFKDNEHQEAQ